MGGQLVTLPNKFFQKGFAIQVDLKPRIKASNFVGYSFDFDPNDFNIKRLPASFHLPEICRQIYSEATLTAYQQNIFLFDSPFERSRRHAFNCLRAVQRRAIKSVEIGALRLYATMRGGLKVVPMTDKLPNLKFILVSATALLKTAQVADELQHGTEKDWQIAVSRRLREVEGDNIKVEFEK
jgi:hypothetical protein